MREVIMQYSGEGEDSHDLRKVGELVRCAECKHSIDFYQDGQTYCRRPEKEMSWIEEGSNFYCGAGERKEDSE